MSERSMPERTVDAWVASAICAVFPDAQIWDPTQAMKGRNWDRAALPLEEGEIFIFEDKGTMAVRRSRKEPLQTHRIDIGADQLNWYCDEVEPASDIPVYYVLPRPPWNGGASSRHIPEQAACRVASSAGPFSEWAYVSRCVDIRRQLGPRRTIDTDQLPLPGGMTLAAFLGSVRSGKAGKWLSAADEEDILSFRAASPESEQLGRRQRSHTGSALSVFVPLGNLQNSLLCTSWSVRIERHTSCDQRMLGASVARLMASDA
jgi:hypothetical protein